MTYLNNEVCELNSDELDTVTGGKGLLETIGQVVKEAVQVATGTSGTCTNHWYSD